MRLSLLVSVLLAGAFAATVLGAALLVGLFPAGSDGVAVASATPTSTFEPETPPPTPIPTPTEEPTPSPEPTIDLSEGGTYTVKSGDFLVDIGRRLGVPWQMIADANNITPPNYVITPGQVLIIPAVPVPSEGAMFHVVQPGDTITGIAQQYGVSPTDLADYNRIADWNDIHPDQLLYIPGPGWTPLPEPTF